MSRREGSFTREKNIHTKHNFIYTHKRINFFVYQRGEVDASEVEGGPLVPLLVPHKRVGVDDDGALLCDLCWCW